jgi:elongation factor G
VAVFDASQGVEPQSETVWRQADKYNVPRLCFINKMDKTGADFFMSLESIKKRLNPKAVAYQLPIGTEDTFSGVIDLLTKKAYKFEGNFGEQIIEIQIPQDMVEKVEKYRSVLVEKIVEFDDSLTEKYLNGEEIDIADLKKALRKGVIANGIYPVLCGTALQNTGIQLVLDAVCDYLPSPLDVPELDGTEVKDESVKVVIKADEKEPFVG